MKSAYVRAMEKVGDDLREFTPEQKARLNEINSLYESKIAQAKIHAETVMRQVGDDQEKQEQVRKDLAVELASYTELRERKKEEARREFGQKK